MKQLYLAKIYRVLSLCTVIILCLSMLPLGALAAEKSIDVYHGDRSKPRIAITVDDCYDEKHIQAVIDLCVEFDVPVTFFVIGKALKYDHQQLWQDAIDAGCEIGNHTWGHVRLPTLNSRQIKAQLRNTQEKLDGLLGYHYPMQVMRPPFGTLSLDSGKTSRSKVLTAIEEAGYLRVIRWDVSQTDPAKAIKDVKNGSILLYHTNGKDVRCLATLIPQLLEQGYECVTVSELLNLPPIELPPPADEPSDAVPDSPDV